MKSGNPFLVINGVSKKFPGVQALDGVSLTLRKGEVLAVVGENGAGKSTLMKIIGGIYTPDTGSILLDNNPVEIANVATALSLGISLIHQELNLAENLSVTANLFLGRELCFGGPLRLLNHQAMQQEARELIQKVGLECSPDTIVGRMSPGQRQLVEIARALSMQVRILIMDEPTSSLTQKETDRLYQVIDGLKAQGVSVLYISHRLAEVQRLADRVVVLRDGRNAGELSRNSEEGISHGAMVRLMVGRDLQQFYQRKHSSRSGQVRLSLRRFQYRGIPGDPTAVSVPVDLELHAGEIMGMSGLVGAGRTELAEAVFGLRPVVQGEMLIDGQPFRSFKPRKAVAAGILLVPEDRRHHGLILSSSVENNICLPNLDEISFLRMLPPSNAEMLAAQMSGKMQVRSPSVRQRVGLLSGGNQQKVVLGKWLARKPKVLIVDEPTRGIDIGAKSEIYALLDHLAGEGVAIWMISSDLEEIMGMSDRVAVLHEGHVADVLTRDQLSEEAIMHLATGGRAKR